jgi:hypothetical protein
MPAGTNCQTATLDRIAAVAAAYGGGITVTVSKGYKVYTNAENLEQLVGALTAETKGYFNLWLAKAGTAENELRDFEIHAELLVAVPKDVSTDLNAAWDFVIDFAETLANESNYDPSLLQFRPKDIEYSLHNIRNGIAIFDFGAYGGGGITVSDP